MCSTCELNASISFDLCAGCVSRNIPARQAVSRYSGWKKLLKWPMQPNGKNQTTETVSYRCIAFVTMRKFLSRVHLRIDDTVWEGEAHPTSRESQAIFPDRAGRYFVAISEFNSLCYGATCTTRVIRFADRSFTERIHDWSIFPARYELNLGDSFY